MSDDHETDGAGMDPIVGASVTKAAASASEETGKLLGRVLGPAADEIGGALGRYTALRMQNVGRIVRKADRKSRGKPPGQVPPRLAHKLVEEGSYCDDELMAEYLSGMLAAGRTPNGRDDRAVYWSSLVTVMSTLQLRAHFLLYREWAVRLNGRADIRLDELASRERCEIVIDVKEFMQQLAQGLDVNGSPALTHAMTGLERVGLLGRHFSWGPRSPEVEGLFDGFVLRAVPTVAGMELYGWAQGEPGMIGHDFKSRARSFAEDEFPRLSEVALPLLDI